MIDILEQKKSRKRNLILLAVLLVLFVVAWVYVSVETSEYTVKAYGFSESLQKYMEVEVKNPFAKHVFLKCISEVHETEPEPNQMGPFFGIGATVTLQKGENGARHTHTAYGTQSLCFETGGGIATVYDHVPRKVISQMEFCIDLCVR